MYIWQISCGEPGRWYDDLFLQHDVMFCGPGGYGAFDGRLYGDLVKQGALSASRQGRVRRFVEAVEMGDTVLLRRGRSVTAMGVVAEGGYQHNPTFDDIYGWDLEHSHRVIWQHQLSEELASLQSEQGLFHGRPRMPSFEGVNDDRILGPIRQLSEKFEQRELADLPDPPSDSLTLPQLEQGLFNKGLAYDTAHRVCESIARIRRLIQWYDSSGMAPDRPAEHEVVAHVILPLMMALGWSEQLLAVEWHKVDLAVFNRTPTTKSNCQLVCEAKKIGRPMQKVLKQAKRYVAKLGLDGCHRILVTDGQRFYAYERDGDHWPSRPVGYLNLLKIRERHVCPVDTNGVETLVSLTPAGVVGERIRPEFALGGLGSDGTPSATKAVLHQ